MECGDEFHGINPDLVDPLAQMEARRRTGAGYAGEMQLNTVYSPVVERHLRQIVTTGSLYHV